MVVHHPALQPLLTSCLTLHNQLFDFQKSKTLSLPEPVAEQIYYACELTLFLGISIIIFVNLIAFKQHT